MTIRLFRQKSWFNKKWIKITRMLMLRVGFLIQGLGLSVPSEREVKRVIRKVAGARRITWRCSRVSTSLIVLIHHLLPSSSLASSSRTISEVPILWILFTKNEKAIAVVVAFTIKAFGIKDPALTANDRLRFTLRIHVTIISHGMEGSRFRQISIIWSLSPIIIFFKGFIRKWRIPSLRM